MSTSKKPAVRDSKSVAARRYEMGRLEQIIRKGSRTFCETGLALAKIRDERLYEDEGYATFEEYCRERWGWSHQRSSQLIQAARLVKELPPKLATYVADEMTARELRKLPGEKQAEIIQQTLDQKLTLTPKLVRAHLPKPEPVPKSEEKLEFEERAGVRKLVRELLERLEALGPTHGVLDEVGPIAQWWQSAHNRAAPEPAPAANPEPEPDELPRRSSPVCGPLAEREPEPSAAPDEQAPAPEPEPALCRGRLPEPEPPANETPAKIGKTQTRRKTRPTTVRGHLSKLLDGLESVVAETEETIKRIQKWPRKYCSTDYESMKPFGALSSSSSTICSGLFITVSISSCLANVN